MMEPVWSVKWMKRVPAVSLAEEKVDLLVIEWVAANPDGSGRLSKRTEWEM